MAPKGGKPAKPDQWINKYRRAAKQRLTTAKFLLDYEYCLDSMYLAGYSVECAFKALILAKTLRGQRASTLVEISSGQEAHNFEHLNDLLKKRGCAMPIGCREEAARDRQGEMDDRLALRSRSQVNRRGESVSGERRGILRLGGKEPVMDPWESLRTPETKMIEDVLKREFPNVNAYRFNSASIRVRVVDERFEGKSIEEREAMVSPLLDTLPEETQADIMILLTLAPSETQISSFNRRRLVNLEFENPSRSML